MDRPYILPDPSEVCAGFPNINVYELEIELTEDQEESKNILVPADVEEIAVTVDPEGCEVTVFTTMNLVKKVKQNNPSMTWVEWAAGPVSDIYQDACVKVTALKIKQIGEGTVNAQLRMQ